MRLYDGKKLVSIEMNNWTENGYTPDWSIDFFAAGNLPYDEDMNAYIVEDVDYCIEQADDWKNSRGDYYDPDVTPSDIESRNVDVEVLQKAHRFYIIDNEGTVHGESESRRRLKAMLQDMLDNDGEKYKGLELEIIDDTCLDV